MTRPYFTLAVRDYPAKGATNRKWGPEFGDYDRETVEAELEDWRRNYPANCLKIIRTETDDQRAIENAIRNLNGLCIGCDNPPLEGYRVCSACGEEGLR